MATMGAIGAIHRNMSVEKEVREDTVKNKKTILRELISMSRSLGRPEKRYAILGEGNTSARIDAETFFVKASGAQLGEADEGAFVEVKASVVLEALEHAQARGAHIHAEVLGHASSSDAFHVAQPDPEGLGASRAMQWALDDAGLTPADVDYINAHGSSTQLNDVIETKAIKRTFGDRAYEIPISSTKSMLGHAMGGAGAIEAAVCALTVERGLIHPTINLENPDPACDLDYVPEGRRQAAVRVALSNSFGLGGQNACLVLRRFEEN